MKHKRTRLCGGGGGGDLLLLTRLSTKPSPRTYLFSLLFLLLVTLLFLQYYNGPTSKLRRTQELMGKIQLTNCTAFNFTRRYNTNTTTSGSVCPDYFHWIHEDLKPWATSGITKKLVNRARKTATFKLVIVNGRVYIEKYKKAIQTRDVYTLWGILQLLRRYPGKIPDLELMFDCADRPVINAAKYSNPSAAAAPPPLFRYCADNKTLDIVFPDWSFWGWPEINIKPWEAVVNDIKQGNKKSNWLDREPYAYWKGNPYVDKTRQDLLKCNVSDEQDWNARLFSQDWIREWEQGYKSSDLGSQCTHRYKIYIEGYAWSVSEKYILACDSPTLIVTPKFYDFFTRALVPQHHYWPIKENDKCRSIKFAVEWGNSNKHKARSIGKAASKFVQEDLKMEYVYDYMFQLLNQYSKLLRFRPKVPRQAVELHVESMACRADGTEKRFMMESLVKIPTETSPCTMPPPFESASLDEVLRKNENSINQVELWEKNYWEKFRGA